MSNVPIDAHGHPICFKIAQGSVRSPVVTGAAGSRDTMLLEVRQAGHHQKESVIREGASGSAWRMASDEGVHLKGTDLAPFPLGYFNAGLQADLAGRVVKLAGQRGVAVKSLSMKLKNGYSLTGSFLQGTGVGVGEYCAVEVDLETSGTRDDGAQLVRDGIDASPCFAMLTMPLDNTFALYVNGRRRNPTTLPASPAGDAGDPYLKYARPPAPLADAGTPPDMIVKLADKQPGEPITAPVEGKVVREVTGSGTLDNATGLYRCRTGLNLPASSWFQYLADESAADRAPSGLALATAGIAYCYITQISRYIEHQKLPIRGVRLVQTSPYAIGADGRGAASPCDTHLFMNGEAPEEGFETLMRVAANTCYLHQTMIHRPRLMLTVRQGGQTVWSSEAKAAE
jgi:uncharacterized OsmC-like protein